MQKSLQQAGREAGYQVDGCVGDDYPPVLAHSGDLEQLPIQPTGLHRLIEAPPVQWPKGRRDDDVETLADRVGRRITHDFCDPIPPLANDAVAIDGHARAQVMTSRLRSVHALFTVSLGRKFTRRRRSFAAPQKLTLG